MRDLVFKNLTSLEKKRKIITSCEIMDKQGLRSIVRRHFICIVKEINDTHVEKPLSSLSVLKERNHQKQIERFVLRIKGSVYAINNEKLYLVLFMHSLNISLSPSPLVKYNPT